MEHLEKEMNQGQPQDDGLESVRQALLEIQQTISSTEEDPTQETLVEAVQKHRAMLLNFATMAYMKKPGDPKMLEAVSTLVCQIEKAVRDTRKEKAKKEELVDNKVTFNQMLDAMNSMASGKISVPTFEVENFFLDPSVSLMTLVPGAKAIKETELAFGNGIVDLDGNAI